MRNLILMFGISIMATACAGTGATAPSTEMPSATHTTGAPVPGDTQTPGTDKQLPPLNTTSPTTNPPAAMQNTTTQSAGDKPTPMAPSTP